MSGFPRDLAVLEPWGVSLGRSREGCLAAWQAFGEEDVGESLDGAAEDVVVLGWLGGGVELASAVDDEADDCWAAVGELGVALEEADLAAHFGELVVVAVGVSPCLSSPGAVGDFLGGGSVA